MTNPYTRSPLAPLSSANTITAASSRLEFNDGPGPSADLAAVDSRLQLNRSNRMEQSYSNSSSETIQASPLSWANASLNLRHIDIIVLVTCFITGLTDVAMFANYSTFVSMQTGNTIFIALGASQQNTNGFIWIRCLFSLVAYCFGSYAYSRLHEKWLGPKTRRVTVILSYTLQAAMTLTAAAIIQSGIVGRYTPGILKAPHEQWDSLAPISLLSIAAGGQIVAARMLGVPEVPTVVVTSMLCELWSDPKLFRLRNAGRDRRAMGFVLMLLGGITGGWVDKASHETQTALWLAAGLKLACVVVLGFWKSEDDVATRTVTGEKSDV